MITCLRIYRFFEIVVSSDNVAVHIGQFAYASRFVCELLNKGNHAQKYKNLLPGISMCNSNLELNYA